MKAFLFPGFDSLEKFDQRALSIGVPQVRLQMDLANEILAPIVGSDVDLQSFTLSEDGEFNRNLPLKIAASLTVQTAIFESIRAELRDEDLIVGCSLGDLARTVCSGIASFEETLLGGHRFGQLLIESELGYLYRCSASDTTTRETLEVSLPTDLYLSVYQTPKHFLIASRDRTAEAWLTSQGFRFSILADLPLHSPLMSAILPPMQRTIRASSIRQPKARVFSSLWHREMACANECAEEAGANIVECVDWVRTLEHLAIDQHVDEIVSVGPAPTLLRFAERAPVARPFRMRDAYAELIGACV